MSKTQDTSAHDTANAQFPLYPWAGNKQFTCQFVNVLHFFYTIVKKTKTDFPITSPYLTFFKLTELKKYGNDVGRKWFSILLPRNEQLFECSCTLFPTVFNIFWTDRVACMALEIHGWLIMFGLWWCFKQGQWE